MYPESYPKKIPPNEAKAQIMYAFQVTGASISSGSEVVARPWWLSSNSGAYSFSTDMMFVEQQSKIQRLFQFLLQKSKEWRVFGIRKGKQPRNMYSQLGNVIEEC